MHVRCRALVKTLNWFIHQVHNVFRQHGHILFDLKVPDTSEYILEWYVKSWLITHGMHVRDDQDDCKYNVLHLSLTTTAVQCTFVSKSTASFDLRYTDGGSELLEDYLRKQCAVSAANTKPTFVVMAHTPTSDMIRLEDHIVAVSMKTNTNTTNTIVSSKILNARVPCSIGDLVCINCTDRVVQALCRWLEITHSHPQKATIYVLIGAELESAMPDPACFVVDHMLDLRMLNARAIFVDVQRLVSIMGTNDMKCQHVSVISSDFNHDKLWDTDPHVAERCAVFEIHSPDFTPGKTQRKIEFWRRALVCTHWDPFVVDTVNDTAASCFVLPLLLLTRDCSVDDSIIALVRHSAGCVRGVKYASGLNPGETPTQCMVANVEYFSPPAIVLYHNMFLFTWSDKEIREHAAYLNHVWTNAHIRRIQQRASNDMFQACTQIINKLCCEAVHLFAQSTT